MAVIEKRSGRFGVRWRVRIRKPNLPTITRTFGYKADAETWARQTERSLESGTYNTNPNHETLGHLIIRYADTVSVTKKGTEPERIRLVKIARHTVGKLPIAQLKALHFAQYRDQRLKEVSPSTVKKRTEPFVSCFRYGTKRVELLYSTQPHIRCEKTKRK